MGRLLVVEDAEDTREMVCKLLEVAGNDVICAANGWEALLAIERGGVDLILLDLMMPGMDGPTFLRILRQSRHDKNIPVVVLTAVEREAAEAKTADLGVEKVLQKGGDVWGKLLPAIAQFLKEPE